MIIPQRIFLCHASDDKPFVRALHLRLRADGLDTWLDEEDLVPGQTWEAEITKAVHSCIAVVVCLSAKSISKEGFVQKEIRIALDAADYKPEGTIFVIPARIDDCRVPDRLNRWHWVNLFADNGYDELVKAIRSRVSSLTPSRSNASLPWLLISDGTDFASDLYKMALDHSEVETVVLKGLDSDLALSESLLSDRPLVILVRGEHFQDSDARNFYERLREFVRKGGVLLTTPWVSWETYPGRLLDGVLPFTHSARRFTENAVLECESSSSVPTGNSSCFSVTGSFEQLEVKSGNALREAGTRVESDTEVLVKTTIGIPLLGYKRTGLGWCYYLNICQHSCDEKMESPLRSSAELSAVMRNLFSDLTSKVKKPRIDFPRFDLSGSALVHMMAGIHQSLHGHIFHAESHSPTPQLETSKQLKPSQVVLNRLSPNRRCECGSGKKYKNCCGR